MPNFCFNKEIVPRSIVTINKYRFHNKDSFHPFNTHLNSELLMEREIPKSKLLFTVKTDVDWPKNLPRASERK